MYLAGENKEQQLPPIVIDLQQLLQENLRGITVQQIIHP